MKRTRLLLALLLSACGTSYSFGQAANYYISQKGEIVDEATYEAKKSEKLAAVRKVSKRIKMFDMLTEEYNRNDSIVYTYTWHFTDNIERMKAEMIRDKLLKDSLTGTVYPIQQVTTLDGRSISLDDYKGKPTLVNLWFTGCKPCIDEMPVLSQMKREYGDKYNFLAVTMDNEAKVKRLFRKVEFDMDHIVHSKALTTDLGFNGFPVNLFLDKDGVIQAIEGNIPYYRDEQGELKMDSSSFLTILEGLR